MPHKLVQIMLNFAMTGGWNECCGDKSSVGHATQLTNVQTTQLIACHKDLEENKAQNYDVELFSSLMLISSTPRGDVWIFNRI